MRKLLVAGSVLALAACGGPPIRSKEDAATAAHRVSQAGQFAQSSGEGLRSADGINITVTVKDKQGGTAEVTIESLFGSEGGGITWRVKFKNFAPNGEDIINGEGTYTVSVGFSSDDVSVSLTCKGEFDISGVEYTDHLKTDLTMTAKASVFKVTSDTGTQAGATLTLNYKGTVTAGGTTYTYDEDVAIAANASSLRAGSRTGS